MADSVPAGGILVDIGCGKTPDLILKVHTKMDFCIGIDADVSNQLKNHYQTINYEISKQLPVESELANVVTLAQTLDSLEHKRAVISECFRILKPGGMLLAVTSAITKQDLLELMSGAGFNEVTFKAFVFGMFQFTRSIK